MPCRSATWRSTLVLLFASGVSLHAQSRLDMLVSHLRTSGGDVWDVWTSPVRGTRHDWITAAAALGASALVSPLDAPVDRWAYHNHGATVFKPLQPFREGGFVFSGRAITPLAAGALAASVLTKNERLQEGLFGCLASYAASSVVRNYVVYPLVARTRPDTRQPDIVAPPASQGDQYDFSIPGSADWGRHSFPGGHIANVFACSAFLTRRFSMGALEPVIWGVAGAVGLGRTLDRRHWLSDQLLGGLYGYAVGKQIAIRSGRRAEKARQKDEKADGKGGASGLFLLPDAHGWRFGWQRSFY